MMTGPPMKLPLTKQLSPQPCCNLVSKRKTLSPFLAFGGDWGDPCQSSLSAWKARCVRLPEISYSLCVWLAHGTPKAMGCMHRGGGSHVPLGSVRTCSFSTCLFFSWAEVPLIGSYQSSWPGNKARWSPQVLTLASDAGWETTSTLWRALNLQSPLRTGLRGTDRTGGQPQGRGCRKVSDTCCMGFIFISVWE